MESREKLEGEVDELKKNKKQLVERISELEAVGKGGMS